MFAHSNSTISPLHIMITCLYIFFLVILYLIFGYFIGIIRYRFAHSAAVQSEGWKNAWQAWLFYPVTSAQKSGHSFVYASKVACRPIGENRLVLMMKSHDYVILMMFIWGALFLLTIILYVYLIIKACILWICSVAEKLFYFCITRFRKAINRSLPEDIRVPESEDSNETKCRLLLWKDQVTTDTYSLNPERCFTAHSGFLLPI